MKSGRRVRIYLGRQVGASRHSGITPATRAKQKPGSAHLIKGDVAAGVAQLKEQPGQDLIMYGCHDLMHRLLEHDLIDE